MALLSGYVHAIPDIRHEKSSGKARTERHRTQTSRPHISNVVPQRLAKKVWCTKSQSSLLNIYFRLSIPVLTAIYSLTLHSEYLFTLNQSVALVWRRTYLICGAPQSRLARRCFALLQKSRRNHIPYVWTEALPGMVLVPAQILPGIVWTQPQLCLPR